MMISEGAKANSNGKPLTAKITKDAKGGQSLTRVCGGLDICNNARKKLEIFFAGLYG